MIKLIKKHLQGGDLSKEDKDYLWQFHEKFGADETKEEYFDHWDFLKGDKGLLKYFTSYLNSPGFKRIINNQNKWWKDRHPYRRWLHSPDPDGRTLEWFEVAKTINPSVYTFGSYTDLSFANYPKRTAFIGRYNSDDDLTTDFVAGHEYLHGISPTFTVKFGKYSSTSPLSFDRESALGEALNLKPERIPNEEEWKLHDGKQSERHADIWGLKYLLFKEGIYDSRSTKDITLKLVRQLRKKYPKLRPLLLMTDEQIMFMLNHVAQNDNYLEPTANTYFNG